jgi:hypothetical protein
MACASGKGAISGGFVVDVYVGIEGLTLAAQVIGFIDIRQRWYENSYIY